MNKVLIILFEIFIYIVLVCLNLFALLKIYLLKYNEIEKMVSSNFFDFFVFMKLTGIHLLLGLLILILFYFFRKKKFYFRLTFSIVLILISTSYFYYDYYNNIQVITESQKEIIESIKSKKIEYEAMTLSNKFKKLTFEEYQFIGGVKSANVPLDAYEIEYDYSSDGSFIGDHICNINYKVPLGTIVDIFDIVNNQSSSKQEIKNYKDYIEVSYSSRSW